MRDFFAVISVAMISLVSCLYGINVLSEKSCHSKYSFYGKTEYGFIKGCMITTKDGRYIPSETIREFD